MTKSICWDPLPGEPTPSEFIARHNDGAFYLKLSSDNACLGYEFWLGETTLDYPADGFQAAWSRFESDARA